MRDEAGDKKEIESGRDDNELKNWWVFLAPARRCKNPLPPAAYRILFDSGGGRALGGVSPGRSGKWNPQLLVFGDEMDGNEQGRSKESQTHMYM